MEEEKDRTMGTATINSENVKNSQRKSYLSSNQNQNQQKGQLSTLSKTVELQEKFKDMSLPCSFSTSTSSMVSKYWLQGRGEKSRFLPGLWNKTHAKCHSIWICSNFLNTMERLGRISEKAHLIWNIVALELHTMKKALLSSKRNIGFDYSTERKWDTEYDILRQKLHENEITNCPEQCLIVDFNIQLIFPLKCLINNHLNSD